MPDRPIVIGFDGSAAAVVAVREAGGLLAGRAALIVTVWEAGLAYVSGVPATLDVPATPVDPATASEIDHALDERAHRLADRGVVLAREAGFASAEPVVVADSSNVADTIVEVAREREAQAIVVGSRGLSGLKARLAGSTSRHVIEHADRPVLVVHG